MPAKSAGSVTRLALYGGARQNYGSFAGKVGGGGGPPEIPPGLAKKQTVPVSYDIATPLVTRKDQ